MEGVCYLKVIDNLVRSAMNPAVSGIPSFSLTTCSIERTRTDLKRVSPEVICDYNEHSPLKQHRSDCLEVERQHHDIKLVIPEKNIVSRESKHYNTSSVGLLDSRRTVIFDKVQEINFGSESKPESREFQLQLANGHLETTSASRIGHGGNIRSLSVPRLENAHNPSSQTDDDSLVTKQIITSLGKDVKVKRCRSLPCRSTYDNHQEETFLHLLNKRNQSPCIQRSECIPHEEPESRMKQTCTQQQHNDILQSDSQCRSDNNSCGSGSASPSSCFIDVEADRSPSSPLNLTTNDTEFQVTNDNIPNRSEKSLEDISNLHKQESSLLNNNRYNNEPAKQICDNMANDKSVEKKTNFSIDAILRPDFGSARTSSDASAPFQMCNTTTISPRLRKTIKSFHSAFTAVDLSTRSRSDSLSSPSCSSSSPSPPLSTCSTSPRLKPDFISTDKHIVQDNFMFSSRGFPDPNIEFHNLFNGHIPFINPIHQNGFGNFPFVYSPHENSPNKVTLDRDSLRHQHSQENPRTKSEHLKNDISKFISRSLYPFISPAPNCRPDMLKNTRNHDNQIKTGSGTTMQGCRQNKPSKNSLDSPPSIKSTKSPALITTDTKKESNIQANVSNPDKDTLANCKIELKQEKQRRRNEKSEDSTSKGDDGNQLWPAWVFCTRYSDRPSSGPRSRKPKRGKTQDEKRPRTAFTNDQLVRLKREFEDCRYLTESRRKSLADELGLTESQIKIWFQNKRAKIKKSVGVRNPLALQLMEQGLYNHSTVRLSDDSS